MARFNKIFAGPTRDPLPQVKERLAPAGGLTPGSIVTLNGDDWALHGTAGGRGDLYVVQENYLAMRTPDDDYDEDDTAIGMEPLDEHRFRVLVATGNNVSEGDPLSSLGDGTLGIAGATSGDEVLFFAEESFNNDTGSNQLVTARKASGTMPTA